MFSTICDRGILCVALPSNLQFGCLFACLYVLLMSDISAFDFDTFNYRSKNTSVKKG